MLLSIFKHFFILGCFSFGGPAAHLGYFKKRFVDELKWLSEQDYAQIVALSQFLPGPGSSQTGFAIGYHKAGISGGILAFLAFTSPSVFLMIMLAMFGGMFTESNWYSGVIHGLKLLAVVVVADASWGMFKSFCTNKISQTLCVVTAVAVVILSSLVIQMVMLLICALVGYVGLSKQSEGGPRVNAGKPKILPVVLFALLLIILPTLSHQNALTEISAIFYGAGSLVFGGGHVVLPMLQNMVGDSVSNDVFITGYAAAQAVPGPMFTLATWLGFHMLPAAPIFGALLATVMIFLPGFLLVVATYKYWQHLASKPKLKGGINGINACVTGLLFAALYQPVFISAVMSAVDISLVIIGFLLLKSYKLPIIGLVSFFAVSGAILLI